MYKCPYYMTQINCTVTSEIHPLPWKKQLGEEEDVSKLTNAQQQLNQIKVNLLKVTRASLALCSGIAKTELSLPNI